MHKQLKYLAFFAAVTLSLGAVFASPVVLTVTPSVISNTYPGVVTLGITGLTNTEKVIVEKWMDKNANGAIDPGEWIIDSFKIADQSAMVIGGITNVSVPYDSDSTTGEIMTALTVPPGMPLENMVEHYVYRVVSPTGRFAPVLASFAITNSVLSQSVSGTVYSNGVPAPYAAVVAQDLQANNPVGAAVADASGHYFLTLAPGEYGFIAAAQDCYMNQQAGMMVVLTNGMAVTNDLFMTNGTVTISGNIYDTANSNGIAGLLVQLGSGPLFAVTFTDTNGNYSAKVAPSFWKVSATKERLSRRAYLVSQNSLQVDATAGNVTGANVGVIKGDALFYGRVTDNAGNPFANVQIDLSGMDANFNSLYSGKGYSDTNGYFGVAALGDRTNFWNCDITSGTGTALANFVLNYFPTVTNAPGQTQLNNFVALPVIGKISGHVQDNFGNPVEGVELNADNGMQYQSLEGPTDNNGNYSLLVAAGNWNVEFITGGGEDNNDNLDSQGLSDITGPHVVSVPPTNVVLNLTVFPIGTPLMSAPRRFSPTQFSFMVQGVSNVTYTLQVSTNLATTNWQSLTSFQLTNNPFSVTDPTATNSRRFYRLIKN